jgi:hypothetical protein
MLVFAKNEFELSKRQDDGCTLRDHLRAAERSLRRPIERLHLECPQIARYLWDWFLEISNGRTGSGSGPNPIAYSEIESWSRLFGVSLRPFELTAIKHLDMTYLSVMSMKKEAPSE